MFISDETEGRSNPVSHLTETNECHSPVRSNRHFSEVKQLLIGAPAHVRLQGSDRVNVTTTTSVHAALRFNIVKAINGADRKSRFCPLLFNIL